jgi:hypothetical protein
MTLYPKLDKADADFYNLSQFIDNVTNRTSSWPDRCQRLGGQKAGSPYQNDGNENPL